MALSWVAWDAYLRPRTIQEIVEGGTYQPGTAVTVEGTVTGIHRENTSYGPRVSLELDGYRFCSGNNTFSGAVFGDPAAQYQIGDRFQTVLHFASYRFNGDPAVWAPELGCPFPSYLRAISAVWDSVSHLRGMLLVYNGTDANGWATYEITTTWGDPYRADVLPVTLRKSTPILGNNPDLPQGSTIRTGGGWTAVSALQYVMVSGMFVPNPIVDRMRSLASASSENGTLRFADVNGNGFVDDGDHLDVHLPKTATENAYDTYMLHIGEANGKFAAYVYGGRYIVNGPRGPLETLPSSRTDQRVALRYARDQVGTRVTTTLEVARVWFGSPPAISGLGWSVAFNGTYFFGNLSNLPAALPSGITLAYLDGGATGVVDVGDRIIVGNLPNRTSVDFGLIGKPENVQLTSVSWIAGYGALEGSLPDITLTPQGSGPYRVDANISFWNAELAFNRSIRVSLWENSLPVLAPVALANGTVGTFANGTLAFTDADGDGLLSSGDVFMIQGSPTARYQLQVSFFFGTLRWTAYFGA